MRDVERRYAYVGGVKRMSHYTGGGYFEDEEPESQECCTECGTDNLPFDSNVCEKCQAEKERKVAA